MRKHRFNAFYGLLTDTNPQILILSYYCQRNLPLPMVLNQRAYYSCQGYLQNCMIAQMGTVSLN